MTIQGASRALVTAFLLTSSWTAWAQSAPSPYPRAGLDASPAAPASPSAEVSSPRAPRAGLFQPAQKIASQGFGQGVSFGQSFRTNLRFVSQDQELNLKIMLPATVHDVFQ